MAQNNWTQATIFPEQWTDAANWSLGHVPLSTEDAFVGTNSGAAVVQSTVGETVNSVATSANDDLAILGGTFTAAAGTGPNANSGTIALSDAVLSIGGGSTATFDNGSTGSIVLNGASSPSYSPAIIMIAGSGVVNLTGSGSIKMTIGNPAALNLIEGNISFTPTLVNQSEDISGTGTIGGINFSNDATVETNNNTSSSGGILTIQLSGSFDNFGSVQADNGGTLIFGQDGVSTSLTNDGTISLLGGGADTYMQIAGDVTINSSVAGVVGMEGSEPGDDDFIVSDGHAAALTLNGGTLKGAGTVGDANLTLDNEYGTIDATAPAQNLTLFTGGNTILNSGVLEATNDSLLRIKSPVNNSGTIAVNGAGASVEILAAVSGNGTVDIGPNSDLNVLEEFTGFQLQVGSISGNVQFTGANAVLVLNENVINGGIGGEIVGAAASDLIFVEAQNFVAGEHTVWQQTSSSGGTLSLYNDGIDLYTLDLAGQYNTLDFLVSGFKGFPTIGVRNTPTYAENPGNNDEWILSDGNWVESAGPGSHPSGYNVALTGNWTGDGTDGIIWFDPTTGDTDEWQLLNTQWSGTVDLGTHPTNATDGNSYQIAGTDDSTHFFGNGIDDVLWTSTNADGSIATDIWQLSSSGQWTPTPAGSSPGTHPAGYTVAGTGDWTDSGTDGILWFNPTSGDTDEWQLSGGQWANSVDLGTHPLNSDGNGYQIAGIGDFFDNGRDGVLWTSVNSDGTVATDIWELNSSGQWMASTSPGNHPVGYQVVGVGDFTGTGTSDILWYNASNGDADEWLINNGKWAGSIDLGTHPGGFQIAGVGDFNGDGTKDILWHSA